MNAMEQTDPIYCTHLETVRMAELGWLRATALNEHRENMFLQNQALEAERKEEERVLRDRQNIAKALHRSEVLAHSSRVEDAAEWRSVRTALTKVCWFDGLLPALEAILTPTVNKETSPLLRIPTGLRDLSGPPPWFTYQYGYLCPPEWLRVVDLLFSWPEQMLRNQLSDSQFAIAKRHCATLAPWPYETVHNLVTICLERQGALLGWIPIATCSDLARSVSHHVTDAYLEAHGWRRWPLPNAICPVLTSLMGCYFGVQEILQTHGERLALALHAEVLARLPDVTPLHLGAAEVRDPGPAPEPPVVLGGPVLNISIDVPPRREVLWSLLWEAIVDHKFCVPDGKLLLGIDTDRPVYADRRDCQRHMHILGATGSGKTGRFLLPLLIQLIRGSDDGGEPSPIMIIDLKGDFALYNTARLEAAKRGQRFYHVTPSPEHETDYLDLWGSLEHLLPYPQLLGQVLARAFELYHGAGYGTGFFSKTNLAWIVTALEVTLKRCPRPTFKELLRSVLQLGSRLGRQHGLNPKESSEVANTIRPLTKEPYSWCLDPEVDDPERVLNIKRLVEQRDVAYLWARPSHTPFFDVCRLAIVTFLDACGRIQDHGMPKRQGYIIIDECQHLAAFNMGLLVQTAAACGVSLIFCNQSVESLKFGNIDIRSELETNTFLKVYHSITSTADMDRLQRMAGEELVYLDSITKTISIGGGETWSLSDGDGESEIWTEGETISRGLTRSESTHKNNSSGWASGQTQTPLGWQWNSGSSGNSGTANGTGKGRSLTRSEVGAHAVGVSRTTTTQVGGSELVTVSEAHGKVPMFRPRLTDDHLLDAGEQVGTAWVSTTKASASGDLGLRPRQIRVLSPVPEHEYNLRARTPPPLRRQYEFSALPPLLGAPASDYETVASVPGEPDSGRGATEAALVALYTTAAQAPKRWLDVPWLPRPAK